MKKNHQLSYHGKQISALMLSTLMLMSTTHSVSADPAWYESFDEDFSSWDTVDGKFEIQDGALVEIDSTNIGAYISGGPDMFVAALWHNSSAMVGSWSIDLLMPRSDSIMFLRFISQGLAVNGAVPYASYEIRLKGLQHRGIVENAIELGYFNDLECNCSTAGKQITTASYIFPDDWFRLHFTRNEAGEMKLYIDTQLIVTSDILNPILNQSENIMLGPSNGMKLDNMTYWNEVVDPVPRVNVTSTLPSTKESTNSDTYIFGAGMFLTTSALIVTIRKKKH